MSMEITTQSLLLDACIFQLLENLHGENLALVQREAIHNLIHANTGK